MSRKANKPKEPDLQGKYCKLYCLNLAECPNFSQLTKGNSMKMKNRLRHSMKMARRRRDDDQDERDRRWIASMRRLTKFIRIERYIVNDFYFNKEVEK